MNTTQLFIEIDNEWKEILLNGQEGFPITFNIADVKDILKRNTTYSKTLNIPGTKENKIIFDYIFDVNSLTDFNPNKKYRVYLTIDNLQVLEGYIQLKDIECQDNNYWTFKCNIFGENANFSKNLIDKKLEDLDLSEFNHTFNLQTVTASWYNEWNSGYHYSFIDYNSNINFQTETINISDKNIPLNFFRPNIYVKILFDKIVSQTEFTYESEFLNSDMFKRLIIGNNQNVDLDNNQFKVGLTQSTEYIADTITYSIGQPPFLSNLQTITNVIPFADETAPNFNNFAAFDISNYWYENGQLPKVERFIMNFDFKIIPYSFTGSVLTPAFLGSILNVGFLNSRTLNVQIGLYRSKNPATGLNEETLVDKFTIYNRGISQGAGNNQFGDQEFSPTHSFLTDIKYTYESHLFDKDDGSVYQRLYPNEKIYCRLIIKTYGGTNNIVPLEGGQLKWGIVLNKQQDVLIPNKGTFFSNYVQNLYQIGDVVNMTRVVPRNIKQVDFLDSIIKMFNLYIMVDKINPKKLYIEPRSDFYKQNEILDWSDKLDLSENIDYTPIVDLKQKVILTHKKAEDYYNKDYTSRTNKIFGEYQYDTTNEFSNSDIKIETIFNPTTLNAADIQNQGSQTFIIPKVYNKIPVEQNDFNKVTGDIRIFIRSKQPLSTGGIIYRIENGYTTTPFNVYPYVGHQDNPFNPEFDINFDTPDIVYYNSFTPTNNNLYNLYYRQFFEEIYGKDSKQVSCNLYLTPQDIIDFDYRKLIYIEKLSSGSPTYWRVNKIEIDGFIKKSYKVELIKVLNNIKIPNPPFKEYVNPGLRPNNTSTLVLGTNNDWLNGNTIIAGTDNLTRSSNSLIFGQKNRMGSGQNNILVGESNSIGNGTRNNFLIGGINNIIDNDIENSGIIGGNYNYIGLSGTQSSLDGQNLIIIGGSGSTIDQSLQNVVLINPINTTATQSNTVYIDGNLVVNGQDISTAGYEEITITDLNTNLIPNNLLEPGRLYKIDTELGDYADNGIFLKAISTNKLNRLGSRLFICPRTYQIGTDGFGNVWLGVWNTTLTPSSGNFCIWGGLVWINTTGLNGFATSINELDSNWTRIPKSNTTFNVYTELNVVCIYEYENNWVSYQTDVRGNEVGLSFQENQLTFGLTTNPVDMTDWNGIRIWRNRCKLGIINNFNNGAAIFNNICNSIWRNRNIGQIFNNFITGDIDSNTNNGAISNNKNNGSISTNSNNGSISNNSNSGDILANSNSGSIIDNINAGSININSNTGQIRGNSNTGIIQVNSNTGTISFNTTKGAISFNSNTGIINFNNNGAQISSNSNIGSIFNNTNTGLIINNNNTIASIFNNNNNGNIDTNTGIGGPWDIFYNNNNGDINVSGATADITDPIVNKT